MVTFNPSTGFVWIDAHQVVNENLEPVAFSQEQAKALAVSLATDYREE